MFRRHLPAEQQKTLVRWHNSKNPNLPVQANTGSSTPDLIVGSAQALERFEEGFVEAFTLLARGEPEDTSDDVITDIVRNVQHELPDFIQMVENTDGALSPEMRQMFRSVMGGDNVVDLSLLSRVQKNLDDRQALLGVRTSAAGGRTRRGLASRATIARSAVEAPVERTFVDRTRQAAVSRDATGVQPERAVISEASPLTAWSVRIGRSLAGAARAVFGGDPDVLFRGTNVAVRELIKRPLRDLSTYEADLVQLITRTTHLSTARSRKDALKLVYRYLSGKSVRDHNGRFMMSSGHSSVDSALRSISHYITQIKRTADRGDGVYSRTQLFKQVEDVFSANFQRGDRPALRAFWNRFTQTDDGGMARVKLEEVTSARNDDQAAHILAAIRPVISNDPFALENIAALLVFWSDWTPTVTLKGREFTRADVISAAGDTPIAELLMRGSEEFGLPGISSYVSSSTQQAQIMYMLGFEGAVGKVFDSWGRSGLGLSGDKVGAYIKHVTGVHTTNHENDLVEEVVPLFGEHVTFMLSPESAAETYLPRVALERLDELRSRALRQVSDGMDAAPADFLKALSTWVNMTVVFGNVIARQPFQFMSLKDLSVSTAVMTGNARAAAVSTARAAGMVLASALRVPMTGGTLDLFRAANIADAVTDKRSVDAAQKMLRDTSGVALEAETTRAVVERAARRGGELIGEALDTLLSGSVTQRYEINAILEGGPGGIMQDGRFYSYATLREIFLEAGAMSTPYREMRSVLQNDMASMSHKAQINWLRTQGENLTNRELATLEGVIEQTDTWVDNAKGLAAETLRGAVSHGLQVADAYSVAERIGLTVTLMENGLTPRDAARTAVQVLYDYQGSMSAKDNDLWVRLLLPFWAFRKNANMQFANAVASARGAYIIGAFRRANQFGPQAITSVLYEAAISPYGINVSGLNEDQQEFYYSVRNIIENGYGDYNDPEVFEHLKSVLSPDDFNALSSGEGLQGWSKENGYNGYRNVPEDMQLALRSLFASKFEAFKYDGELVQLSVAREREHIVRTFVESGVGASAARSADPSRIPRWMQTRPVVEVPWPSFDASAEVFLGQTEADVSDSILLMLPDDFITSAIDFMSSQVCAVIATADQANRVWEGLPSDFGMVLEAGSGVVDFDRTSPTGELMKNVVAPDSAPPVRLHPLIAELFYSAGIPLKQIQRQPGTAEKYASRAAVAALSAGTAFFVGTDFSSKSVATPLEAFVDEDMAHSVRAQPLSDLLVDVKNNRAQQVAYLRGGRPAALFEVSPLGQINKTLLQYTETVLEKHGDVDSDEAGAMVNDILDIALDVFRGVGGRTYQYADDQLAQQETPR